MQHNLCRSCKCLTIKGLRGLPPYPHASPSLLRGYAGGAGWHETCSVVWAFALRLIVRVKVGVLSLCARVLVAFVAVVVRFVGVVVREVVAAIAAAWEACALVGQLFRRNVRHPVRGVLRVEVAVRVSHRNVHVHA